MQDCLRAEVMDLQSGHNAVLTVMLGRECKEPTVDAAIGLGPVNTEVSVANGAGWLQTRGVGPERQIKWKNDTEGGEQAV